MNLQARCKLCQKPLSFDVPDNEVAAYAELGKIEDLIKMVICNRCGDFMVAGRETQEAIRNCAMALLAARGSKLKELSETMRPSLLTLTRRYAEHLTTYKGYPSILWDQAFADMIIDRPEKWFDILVNYKRQAKLNFAQPNLTT